jgi:hypothetical protein
MLIEEWIEARTVGRSRGAMGMVNPQMKWLRPPRGFLKCNVNASFSTSFNKVGIGVYIRDEMEFFVGAKTVWL